MSTGFRQSRNGYRVAVKLQTDGVRDRQFPSPQPREGSGSVSKSMNRVSQARSVAIVLFLLTLAAVIFAGFNFEAGRKATAPTDGIAWVESSGRLIADQVEAGSPGDKAGIKPGDELV